jgi:two-component system response regulator RegX3
MHNPPPRILYTEDHTDTREMVTLLLTMNNYEVVALANHDEALAVAKTDRFDLYIIDNWLPGISGTDLCKHLREFDAKTPILFYSGAAFERDKAKAFSCGAQGYLIKPASPAHLMAEVSRLISEARNGVSES